MKNPLTTIISALLVGTIILTSSPVILLAQTTGTTNVGVDSKGNTVNNTPDKPNQAQTYREGVEGGKGTAASSNTADTIGSALGCSAGQILANAVVSSVTSLFTNKAADAVTSAVSSNVPVAEKGRVLDNSNLATNAEQGSMAFGGILSGSSWNAIAWCLINAVIEYIANATIAWANSGFNGNPSFVDNPEQFFTDLADQEAASFIQGVVKGATSGAVDVCSPFKVQIAINLSKSYGNQGKRNTCSIDKIVNNYDNFVNGNFSEGGWGGWLALTQNDSNNRYGSYIENNQLMYAKIAKQNNTATLELGWNKGFLSFQKCEDKADKSSCKTTTPGTLIQSSLEKTLNIPKDRLVLAQKFDQVVTAIINNLIKVALNEVLSGGSGSSNQSGSDSSNRNDSNSTSTTSTSTRGN
ncbi:MAG: hypothetical protein RL094_135 [Candidatus Parcubacteria bacterium]|jgi:hypothetical protein